MHACESAWQNSGVYKYLTLLGITVVLMSPATVGAEDCCRVIDETGVPIAGAAAVVNGLTHVTDSNGTFKPDAPGDGLITIDISASGYYGFRHTLDRDDSLEPITLVKRSPGRQLLMFAGDAMLARRFFEPRASETATIRKARILEDGKALLSAVRPYVELADFSSVNLETQLSATQLRNAAPKSVTFYSPPELATLLEWAGFDYVALGNNHSYDFLDEGVETTLAALQSTGLGFSGAGRSEAEARRDFVTDIGGTPYSFLSYVGWAGTFVPTQTAMGDKGGAALGTARVLDEDIAGAVNRGATIVQLHAGLEYVAEPPLTERTKLRNAIDAGAALALGHHAHVLQGFEIYGGALIAYSLGNFLFDQYHYTTQMGMLLFVWLDDGEFHRAEIVPVNISGYKPTPATGAFRYAVLNRLARLSARSDICLVGSGAHASILKSAQRCALQDVAIPVEDAQMAPLSARLLGASPLQPMRVRSDGNQYRLGIDLLRRGDFESFDHFSAADRSWIDVDGHSPVQRTAGQMRIEVAGGDTVRAGMKVFERVFVLSNPATVTGRIRTDGDATVRVMMQRRPADAGLDEALAEGPLTEIGKLQNEDGRWQTFSFDFSHPRIATRSVRILFDIHASTRSTVFLDDIAWVQWETPWISGNEAGSHHFGSHIQVLTK